MSPDPWTSFLDWLNTVLVPAWGELIGLLPYVVTAMIIGPIITIVVLMWGWHFIKRPRGKVRRVEPQPTAAPLDEDGTPAFPVNVPFCAEHALVYPARATSCTIDGGDLAVSCPVDGTVRNAEIDTCSGCGTRFKLGATSSALVVLPPDGPPEGGAAVA